MLLLPPLVIAGYLAFKVATFWYTPAEKGGREVVVQIPGGSSLLSASWLLADSEVIRSVKPFVFMVKLRGQADRIQAGELMFRTDMTPAEVMEVLTRGKAVTYQVTIPEGYNMYQVASILAAKGLVKEERFLALSRDPEFCRSLEVPGDTLEGFLFPDTYSWPKGLSEEEVLSQMVARYKKVFTEDMRRRAREMGMTELEVVTLASIIEKETGLPEERPLVSAVFHNRLKRAIPLCSDPTVIYGLDDFDGNITREDLTRETPYNTYLIQGLPPGPISNPGRSSIWAALYPAPVKYLYFVSRNDGSHHFSTNLKEHNVAVWRYQKRGRAAPKLK